MARPTRNSPRPKNGARVAAADLALLLVYGGVVVYFLRRFVVFRRWPSLGVALLPCGWIVVAVAGVRTFAAVKWAGVAAGLLLLGLVLEADRSER